MHPLRPREAPIQLFARRLQGCHARACTRVGSLYSALGLATSCVEAIWPQTFAVNCWAQLQEALAAAELGRTTAEKANEEAAARAGQTEAATAAGRPGRSSVMNRRETPDSTHRRCTRTSMGAEASDSDRCRADSASVYSTDRTWKWKWTWTHVHQLCSLVCFTLLANQGTPMRCTCTCLN